MAELYGNHYYHQDFNFSSINQIVIEQQKMLVLTPIIGYVVILSPRFRDFVCVMSLHYLEVVLFQNRSDCQLVLMLQSGMSMWRLMYRFGALLQFAVTSSWPTICGRFSSARAKSTCQRCSTDQLSKSLFTTRMNELPRLFFFRLLQLNSCDEAGDGRTQC